MQKKYLVAGLVCLLGGLAVTCALTQENRPDGRQAEVSNADLSGMEPFKAGPDQEYGTAAFDDVTKTESVVPQDHRLILPREIREVLALTALKSMQKRQTDDAFSLTGVELTAAALLSASSGPTRQKLAAFFEKTPDKNTPDRVNQSVREFLQKKSPDFQSVQTIWARRFEPAFVENVTDSLSALTPQIPERSREVNRFMQSKVRDRLTDFIPDGVIDREIAMMLFSTSVYHAQAAENVFVALDEKAPFNGKSRPVQYAAYTAEMGVYEDAEMLVVRLPLAHNDSLLVMMPKEKSSLDKLIAKLTPENLFRLPFNKSSLTVSLPQINIRSRTNLEPFFKRIGLGETVAAGAGYKRLNQTEGVFPQLIFAQTLFSLSNMPTFGSSAKVRGVVKHLRFDRPFLWVTDNPSVAGVYTGETEKK